ncbi:MAG: hypothetical protein LBU39_00715 [Desulfobulbaceae bacterium]|nr:hypothetical protein [Desulfobulbaceae bacterium]
MGDVWQGFLEKFQATEVPRQLLEHDLAGLCHNPWFLVPLGLLLLWMVYRNAWRDIAIVALILGLWWFSGSEFMDGTVVDGKPILGKLVPVIGVFLAAVIIIAYLLFL